jgi:hypothetical protein
MKDVNKDIKINDISFVSVKSNLIVEMNENLVLVTKEDTQILEITVRANLETVPEKYREIFINMLTSKYFNKVTLDENPFYKPEVTNKGNSLKRIFKLFIRYFLNKKSN